MMSVLIVDDSRLMRNVVKNAFSSLNIPCSFLEAGNGKEALELLPKNHVDLILLDWNMPEMTGISFLQQIRAIDAYKTLPIIMVTSEGARFHILEALSNGATDYIIKPINETTLMEKLTLLQRKFPKHGE
jgi:two-component system chemotaxis response regulator CheY